MLNFLQKTFYFTDDSAATERRNT